MTVLLEELLAAATAWDDAASYYEQQRFIDAHRDLRKIAPDAVRLLIDMGAALTESLQHPDHASDEIRKERNHHALALLARLDRLGT